MEDFLNVMTDFRTFLTIAGSDPSGGAGIQADLKTAQYYGLYGMSVITCVTAQNSTGLRNISPVSPDLLADQLKCIEEELIPDVVKIGLLTDNKQIDIISEWLTTIRQSGAFMPVILDPVLSFTAGGFDHQDSASLIDSYVDVLLPLTDIITPNQNELCGLTHCQDGSYRLTSFLSKTLIEKGCRVVVATGSGESPDYIFTLEESMTLPVKKITTRNHHGTGCIFSSSIACNLVSRSDYKFIAEKLINGSLSIEEISKPISEAKRFVEESLDKYRHINFGNGYGPANFFIQ